MFGHWTVHSGVGTWHYTERREAISKARELRASTWVSVRDAFGGQIFF